MPDPEPPFIHHQIDPGLIPVPQHESSTRVSQGGVSTAFEPPPLPGEVPTAELAGLPEKPRDLWPRWSWVSRVIVVFCWTLVAGFVVFSLLQPYVETPSQVNADGAVADQPLGMTDQVEAVYFVGWMGLAGGQEDQAKEMFEQLAGEPGGTYNQRLAKAVLVGELIGYEEGQERLQEVAQQANDAGYDPTASEQQNHDVLNRAFADYVNEQWEAPSVTAEERQQVEESLGWIGVLALEPDQGGSARRLELERSATNFAMMLVLLMVAGVFALMFGMLLLLIVLVLVATGKIRSALTPQTGRGHIYIETFVVWMFLFIGISLVLGIVLRDEATQLKASVLGFPASLLALVWPMIRGVAPRDVFGDVGLTTRRLWLEPFAGLAGYLAGLPLLLFAGFVMIALTAIFAEQPSVNNFEQVYEPSHPINKMVESGGWTIIAAVVITACVMAPLVEETVFRGILYRHLRDMTAPMRVVVSTLVSAAVSGFVFAAIHPQGIFVVPVLGMLGFLFAVVREWRGSLVASMTMHAIHNGMVMVMLLLLLSFVSS